MFGNKRCCLAFPPTTVPWRNRRTSPRRPHRQTQICTRLFTCSSVALRTSVAETMAPGAAPWRWPANPHAHTHEKTLAGGTVPPPSSYREGPAKIAAASITLVAREVGLRDRISMDWPGDTRLSSMAKRTVPIGQTLQALAVAIGINPAATTAPFCQVLRMASAGRRTARIKSDPGPASVLMMWRQRTKACRKYEPRHRPRLHPTGAFFT